MSEERPRSQFMLPDPPEGTATATKPHGHPQPFPRAYWRPILFSRQTQTTRGEGKEGLAPPHPPVTQGPGFLPPGSQESSQLGCWRGKEGEGFRGRAGEGQTLFSLPFHLANSVMWSTTLKEPGKCIRVILQEEEDGVLATNSCLCHINRLKMF